MNKNPEEGRKVATKKTLEVTKQQNQPNKQKKKPNQNSTISFNLKWKDALSRYWIIWGFPQSVS